jgi:putative peptidoglycan lipid II flippase
MAEFRQTVSHSLGTVFLLTIPSSIGLVVLGESIVGAIYQGGAFQAYDTERTALALAFYAIGLSGYAALKVLVPAFYSLGDSRTPMVISLTSILINYMVASSMIRLGGLGHAGLALSTSAVALFAFFVQIAILRNRIGGIHGRALMAQVGRIAVASVTMAVVVWLSSRGLRNWLGITQLARIADLTVSLPLGGAVYYWSAKALGLGEIDLVMRSFTGPLQRWLKRS